MINIKTLRERARLTQCCLAERLGVTQACIAKWETGEAMPTADKLPQLATILNCTIDELFKKK